MVWNLAEVSGTSPLVITCMASWAAMLFNPGAPSGSFHFNSLNWERRTCKPRCWRGTSLEQLVRVKNCSIFLNILVTRKTETTMMLNVSLLLSKLVHNKEHRSICITQTCYFQTSSNITKCMVTSSYL